jgi:hypothetical protein
MMTARANWGLETLAEGEPDPFAANLGELVERDWVEDEAPDAAEQPSEAPMPLAERERVLAELRQEPDDLPGEFR